MTTFLLSFAGSFVGAALGCYWMTARLVSKRRGGWKP